MDSRYFKATLSRLANRIVSFFDEIDNRLDKIRIHLGQISTDPAQNARDDYLKQRGSSQKRVRTPYECGCHSSWADDGIFYKPREFCLDDALRRHRQASIFASPYRETRDNSLEAAIQRHRQASIFATTRSHRFVPVVRTRWSFFSR